jgi:N utilization substance protein B
VINQRARRLARERALQFLYGLDFTGYEWESTLEGFWDGNNVRPTVRQYAERLIRGVCEAREELDARIGEALENWSMERVGHIERAIIRVALFEMIYMQDVPAGVAINEALEVAKAFGSEEAPRFVNGVLDRLKKKIEEEIAADPLRS